MPLLGLVPHQQPQQEGQAHFGTTSTPSDENHWGISYKKGRKENRGGGLGNASKSTLKYLDISSYTVLLKARRFDFAQVLHTAR